MSTPITEPAPGVGYIEAMRMFSRNARLYVLDVIGMDMIHGSWMVLFNLYLLAIGFDVKFVGLRLIVAGVAGAFLSVPAGVVSDRIGRKASFILGDGLGATLGVINILTLDRSVLLTTAVVGAFFSSLHHVSEPPFMHENSKPAERIHLFSISDSLRTASAMVGSLLAGFLPLLLAARVGKLTAYRYATFVGLGLWFLSLIPALMLRREGSADDKPQAERQRRGFFASVENPALMAKLVAPELLLALGGGLVLPLANVFFSHGLHAHEGHIGSTFAGGQLAFALSALLAPLLVARMSKVSVVCITRLAAVPFVLVLAMAMSQRESGWAMPVVMGAWILRTSVFNMSSPIESAFNMEILSLRERATLAGLDAAAYAGMTALGAFISSRLLTSGDYSTPFVGMAAMYVLSTALFWKFFKATKTPFVAEPPLEAPALVRFGP